MLWLRRRLSYANVVAGVALFLALSGGAYALMGNRFVGTGGVIRMCVRSADNVPQVVSPGGKCPAGSTPLTFNRKGRRGPRGPRGAPGATGSPPAAGYISAYQGLNGVTVPGGGTYTIQTSNGNAGVELSTGDIRLGNDNATFDLATAGTYLVTAAVGPAGPVQLQVNGS